MNDYNLIDIIQVEAPLGVISKDKQRSPPGLNFLWVTHSQIYLELQTTSFKVDGNGQTIIYHVKDLVHRPIDSQLLINKHGHQVTQVDIIFTEYIHLVFVTLW